LQLEYPAAYRVNLLKNQIDRNNSKERNYFFLGKPKFSLPPNGPELSCGGKKPPQRSSLRGRSDQMR
jgi:hypothetical protein